MASLNKVQLIGNLTRDPEIRHMNNGERVASFSVATNERWKDKHSGEWKEKAEFHNVVSFNERCINFAEAYLKKGASVYVEGQLQTRKWQKDGVDRYSTEIVITRFNGDLKGLDKASRPVSDEAPARQMGGGMPGSGGGKPTDLDDSIPFTPVR